MGSQRFGLVVLATSLVAAWNEGSFAQASGPRLGAEGCYDLILPQRQSQFTSPLLFNRCTGATWVLVRTGMRSVYRWVSLEIDDPLLAGDDRVARAPRPQGQPSASGAKCFEFTGRRFCE